MPHRTSRMSCDDQTDLTRRRFTVMDIAYVAFVVIVAILDETHRLSSGGVQTVGLKRHLPGLPQSPNN